MQLLFWINLCKAITLGEREVLGLKEKKEIPIIFPPGSIMRSDQDGIVTDPFGMYTGVANNEMEVPGQDADDL